MAVSRRGEWRLNLRLRARYAFLKVLYILLRICRPTLLACTRFQKTPELRRKSFGELGNAMCGAKAIRGHRLVCPRKNLQKLSIGKARTRGGVRDVPSRFLLARKQEYRPDHRCDSKVECCAHL